MASWPQRYISGYFGGHTNFIRWWTQIGSWWTYYSLVDTKIHRWTFLFALWTKIVRWWPECVNTGQKRTIIEHICLDDR